MARMPESRTLAVRVVPEENVLTAFLLWLKATDLLLPGSCDTNAIVRRYMEEEEGSHGT